MVPALGHDHEVFGRRSARLELHAGRDPDRVGEAPEGGLVQPAPELDVMTSGRSSERELHQVELAARHKQLFHEPGIREPAMVSVADQIDDETFVHGG